MKTSDITDRMVCEAYRDAKAIHFERWPYDLLMERTGAPLKVCLSAMDRAYDHGLVECGVSLRTAWLTDKGNALLDQERTP